MLPCYLEVPQMFTASSGIMLIDMIFKPFFKIGEKFPIVCVVLVCLLYAYIAYVALKSAYLSSDHG